MNKKNTEFSISDKWSIEEQLGAALRELDVKNCARQQICFEEKLLSLMQQFDISACTVLEWWREGILK